MLGSVILDVALGLALVYMLFSLIASAIQEVLEAWLKSRAAHLERGIRELLSDPNGTALVRHLYAHPLVSCLYRGSYPLERMVRGGWSALRSQLPSYIPSRNFALALMDLVTRGPDATSPVQASASSPRIELGTVRAEIERLNLPAVQRAVLVALDTAEGDLGRFQAALENWYDSSMDRVSGWYKRQTQVFLLAIGAVLAVVANVDSVALGRYLYSDRAARDAIVAEATAVARDSANRSADVQTVAKELQKLNLPIGWPRTAPRSDSAGAARPRSSTVRSPAMPQPRASAIAEAWSGLGLPGDAAGWLAMIVGWLLTAVAVSQGAPFWFDVLNRISVVRSTVKPHEKSPEEGSKDRAPARASTPAPPQQPAATAAAGGFTPQAWAKGDPEAGVL